MIALSQVLVVEGRYDKNRLKQIFDATVIDTGGFAIFNDRQKLALLRRMAESRGLIVLTDADGAGLVIRNFLKSSVGKGTVYQAYIPAVSGKERRKRQPGREGLLGVEGMDDNVIIEAVRKSGAMDVAAKPPKGDITKTVFYELGLSGGPNSAERRKTLCRRLELPVNLSSNSLLEVLNIITDHQGLGIMMDELDKEAHP